VASEISLGFLFGFLGLFETLVTCGDFMEFQNGTQNWIKMVIKIEVSMRIDGDEEMGITFWFFATARREIER
jgi:hypothetical protein